MEWLTLKTQVYFSEGNIVQAARYETRRKRMAKNKECVDKAQEVRSFPRPFPLTQPPDSSGNGWWAWNNSPQVKFVPSTCPLSTCAREQTQEGVRKGTAKPLLLLSLPNSHHIPFPKLISSPGLSCSPDATFSRHFMLFEPTPSS